MTVLNAPQHVTEAVQATTLPRGDNWITGGESCEGSKFHSPSPLLVREHNLADQVLALVGGDPEGAEADFVWLCSTCHDNLTVYLSLLCAYDGVLPWKARREFGNVIRSLGQRAWEHHLVRRGVLSAPS